MLVYHLLLLIFVVGRAAASNPYDFKPRHKLPGQARKGKIKTSDIPMMITFTHDDNTDSRSAKYVQDITERFTNPNGCKIPAVMFTTQRFSDCATVQKLYYEKGYEIGGHSVTHRKTNQLSSSEKKKEVTQVRNWLVNECKIPASDVNGWRNPYLLGDAEIRKYLADAGYLYDSSMPEFWNSKSSPSGSRKILPYNMKYGIAQMQSCSWFGPNLNRCTKSERPDLVQIPMYMYQRGPSKPAVKGLMDPPGAYKVLKREFERNYRSSNRLPVTIYTHSTSTNYLNQAKNRSEIKKFLSWAMKKKNVWVVTYRYVTPTDVRSHALTLSLALRASLVRQAILGLYEQPGAGQPDGSLHGQVQVRAVSARLVASTILLFYYSTTVMTRLCSCCCYINKSRHLLSPG